MKSDLILLSGDASFMEGFVTKITQNNARETEKNNLYTWVSFVAFQTYLCDVVEKLQGVFVSLFVLSELMGKKLYKEGLRFIWY
jgi:hypothetical protein